MYRGSNKLPKFRFQMDTQTVVAVSIVIVSILTVVLFKLFIGKEDDNFEKV